MQKAELDRKWLSKKLALKWENFSVLPGKFARQLAALPLKTTL